MEYQMKVKELDKNTLYPIDVLAGMTGLGFDTIHRLEREGRFSFQQNEKGEQTVKGEDFLTWAESVDHRIEIDA